MYKHYLISIVAVIGTYLCVCGTSNASASDTLPYSNGITVGYIQDIQITNRGCQFGLERYLFQNVKYKVIGGAFVDLQRKQDVFTTAGAIFGYSLRRTFTPGLYFENGLRIGYFGRYYDFDFYKINSDGVIVNIGRTWTSAAIFGYSIGLGYDFSKRTKADIQIFTKPFFFLRFPSYDNVFLLHNYSLEAGITFHPKWAQWR
ncbi:MAG: hypothetical protein JW795_13460 [Chitinivibrionales bacterium]|nr:hypothetical protein [Chitinivibrionales bacterium]